MKTVHSSHCTITIGDDGTVISIAPVDQGQLFVDGNEVDLGDDDLSSFHDIAKFDLAEYNRHYPGQEGETGYDILDLGFWKKDGTYVEPEHEFRLWAMLNRVNRVRFIRDVNLLVNTGKQSFGSLEERDFDKSEEVEVKHITVPASDQWELHLKGSDHRVIVQREDVELVAA